MLKRLENKVCFITGSTGIAAATAELAIREGASVFVTSRTKENGVALLETLRQHPGESDFFPADLTNAAGVAAAVESCLRRFGRIDAVFNVAGISGRKYGDGPVHECSDEGWEKTMTANAQSLFFVCRAIAGQMLNQPIGQNGLRGAILNMASVLAFSPSPKFFATHAYAASKGAIIALSQSMAAYYAPRRIRVNVIAPALVQTPMSARAQTDPAVQHFMKSKQPLQSSMIRAEDVARSAVFLLSDDANAVTGGLLTVDAGWCVSEGQY